jgi:antirestriction protein ArdC
MMNSHALPRWTELLHSAVTEPGTVSTAYRRFHAYSIRNQLLAMAQCHARSIEAGPIATYSRWKELGRHVRKGEKAITLCMPVTRKIEKPEQSPDEQSSPEFIACFVYRPHWFVLAQTDGKDFTEDPIPTWDAGTALKALDIERVPFTMIDGNVQGYAKHRTVAINPVAESPESTLFHELAHIVLGHTAEVSLNSDSTDRTPKDIRELEAECVALLCTESLALPGAAESRGYIQSWFHGNEVPERSAQRIFTATDAILKAGRLEA